MATLNLKGKFKQPMTNGGKNHTCSLASALIAFDMHILCRENRNWNICRDMNRSAHISASPFRGADMAQ